MMNVSMNFNLTTEESFAITGIHFYPIVATFGKGNVSYHNISWQNIDATNITLTNAFVVPGSSQLRFQPHHEKWGGHVRVNFVKTTLTNTYIDGSGKQNYSVVFTVLPKQYDTSLFFSYKTAHNITVMENSACNYFENVSMHKYKSAL